MTAVPILSVGVAPQGWTKADHANPNKIAWNVTEKTVEAAGQAFFEFLEDEDDKDSVTEADMDALHTDHDEHHIKMRKGLTADSVKTHTYYELLGIDHIADVAGKDLVQKAYRMACLMYHPDKTGKGDDDELFITIQHARETLQDDLKRRQYDSQLPFDERIPKADLVSADKFFKSFGPCFERNAKFAVHKPVPSLGNSETSLEEVYSFYEYWSRFESWRDFTLAAAKLNERNIDSADSREEKRAIGNENNRKAKAMKKEEYSRLMKLVDRARDIDPRILAEREKVKAEKQAKKDAKAAEIKRIQDEKDSKEAEEKRIAQETADKESSDRKNAKFAREQQKKAMRKAKNMLTAIWKKATDEKMENICSYDDLEMLLEKLSVDDLTAINKGFGNSKEEVNAAGMPGLIAAVEKCKL